MFTLERSKTYIDLSVTFSVHTYAKALKGKDFCKQRNLRRVDRLSRSQVFFLLCSSSSLLEISGQRMCISLYAHALRHFKGFVLCDNSQELMVT